ncbi:hypothetical protein PISMIDRAFT_106652 [Pisolithus microcarpus 441]|uniref:Unplaced genomic scaffold scaffold_90, whole genome shotgun sequence n=1 Tax=Pisolithus microcarpus 441 TaxID=765257 RepID=A0A0C9Y5E1_9AGAM|nr:hypothetical protein BKA83DRAFT_106652 [Pisolithus microcarpus]KIK19925.1 hypothetical protein PISMIDRAFT_106652 [Pisolithus microcarpus 441]
MSQDHHPSKKTHPDATLSGQQLAAEELMDVDNAKANSGKGSGHLGHAQMTVIVMLTTLAVYPLLWTKLLDKAKARIWLYVATEEPFLRLETAVDGQCSEEIIELVVKYQEDQSELEAGKYIPFDTFVVCSQCFPIGFYPQYKRSMGKASNFAHPALWNIYLRVYYSNSVKSLHQYVKFQHSVPYKALTLAAAIMSYSIIQLRC